MGKGILDKLNLKVAAVAAALIIGLVNTALIAYVSKKSTADPCVVDIWKISENKALSISLTSKDRKPEEVKNELDGYMREMRVRLSNIKPEEHGCSFVAVKGSILGDAKDITDIVTKGMK